MPKRNKSRGTGRAPLTPMRTFRHPVVRSVMRGTTDGPESATVERINKVRTCLAIT
jgi:hypothetical protein